MSTGCMDAIQKQEHKVPSGKHLHHQQWKRHGSQVHTWRSFWLHFSTWREQLFPNLFLKVKWLNQHFTQKSYDVWQRPSNGKYQRNSEMAGCSSTKTHSAKHHSPLASFWQMKTFLHYCNQPTLPTCHHVTFGCAPNSKKWWKGRIKGRHYFQHNTPSMGDSKRLLDTFSTVAGALEQVHVHVCVCEITLKGIIDKINISNIRSFT